MENAAGRIVTSTDAQGNTIHFRHDPLGRLKAMRSPAGEAGAFAYDAHDYLLGEHAPETPDAAYRHIYRRIGALTPRGQIARERFGNRLAGSYEHAASTGDLLRLLVRPDGGRAAGRTSICDHRRARHGPGQCLRRRPRQPPPV